MLLGKIEIKSILRYDEKLEDKRMFVPNEIFGDFSKIEGNVSNRAFCFSFYYLILYLYRFAKYGERDYTIQDIKEILGYSRTNKTMNNYIKKDGVLNKMGYLEQTNEAPLWYTFDEMGVSKNGKKIKSINFMYQHDLIEGLDEDEVKSLRDVGAVRNRKNNVIKYPVKGFYRDEERDDYNGVFFAVHNTTLVPVKSFLFCITNKELSVEGFWVYSFIKYKSEYYGSDWTISREEMAKEMGISERKLDGVLKFLEKYNMICNSHEPYVLGKPQHYKINSCSYRVVDSAFLKHDEQEISKRDVMSFKSWCEINGINYDQAMDGESYSQEENPFL